MISSQLGHLGEATTPQPLKLPDAKGQRIAERYKEKIQSIFDLAIARG